MAGKPTYPPEVVAQAWRLLDQGEQPASIARQLGVADSTVRAWFHNERPEDVEITLTGDEASDVKALLAERGIDLDEVVITKYSVRQWGENKYLGVDVRPKTLDVIAARPEGVSIPKTSPRKKRDGEPRIVALFGDHHAPHHDKKLHEAVCAWLEDFQPDEGVILGDLLDFDAISRYRENPDREVSVQTCLDEGYSILVGYRSATPATKWRMLGGNHEDRMRNTVLDHAKKLYGLTRACAIPPGMPDGEYPLLSIPFMLRLDELEIEWVDAHGEWSQGQIKLSEELAARHGWIVKKGAGASALASIEALRHSVIIGHTHRQSIVHHTAHNIDGDPRSLLGCEAGTLAEIKGGLGYAVSPDWINGFAVATIWPDGTFHVELATYASGVLRFRDWSYTP